MGIAYYVSAAIVLCFILSTVSVISGDTSVNCTTFDNNTCCNHVECFYVNCTSKANATKTHLGCHAKTDTAGITAVCMNGTEEHICDGPAVIENSCNVTSMDTCCSNTLPDCVWLNCTDKQGQQEGCFNSSDVTCTSSIKLCNETKTTTTLKPTTATTVKTTPHQNFKECQKFADVGSCCSEEIWSCIYVNCSGFQGCYSKSNETNIKANCSATYLDACAATTPVPFSTTTGGDTGRHFDTASFIGGIVLCAGIVLIIFFALKWYRSRQATNNYHQM